MKTLLNKLDGKQSTKNIIFGILIISIIFLLFSFFAPYFFTSTTFGKSIITSEETGLIGDTMGGIMNPFIAITGIFLTFLAFYIQYDANKKVQNQFKVQQFESQFYEMLHLHRENLNEMTIEGYVFEYADNDKSKNALANTKKNKTTSGKKIFVTMLKEFEAIYLICTKIFKHEYNNLSPDKQRVISMILNQFIIDHSYYVFFSGLKIYKTNVKRYIENDDTGFLKLVLNKFTEELRSIKESHENNGIKKYNTYYQSGNIRNNNLKNHTLWLSFNYKPFTGHQSILAHYYRHLFQTVKFVVKQDEDLISYEQKRDYLRILRSMLSNHEQILLYYNWLAGFGSKWEQKNIELRKSKHGNFFFTDYRMVHNLHNDMLLDEFKIKEIFNENYSNFRYEHNRKDEDSLFELVEIYSTN